MSYINYARPTRIYKEQEYSDNYGAYASDIAKAQNMLNQHLNTKPGAYQSAYAPQIKDTITTLENRKPFVYDINADAMYQQLKNEHMNLGKLAMTDTMGVASAMTGGYGNSYAATVGNQAYMDQVSKINDVVPQLYDKAYGRYQDEEAKLYNMLNMYQNQDAIDYAKYQDVLTNWQNDRNYYSGEVANLRGMNQDLWAQNESNRYNAIQSEWNNYYNAESHNLNEQQQARAAAAAKSAQVNIDPFTYNPSGTASDPVIQKFISTYNISKEQYNKKSAGKQGYLGYDSFDDYLDAALDSFKYEVNGQKVGLSDNQKAQLIAYYAVDPTNGYTRPNLISGAQSLLKSVIR